jgi:hypothetical protein
MRLFAAIGWVGREKAQDAQKEDSSEQVKDG